MEYTCYLQVKTLVERFHFKEKSAECLRGLADALS
jgi:hypothetical protein